MTIVCWDGKTLAADKRATHGGMIRTITKIRRYGKIICGGAGELWALQEIFKWVEHGRKLKDFPECQKEKDDYVALLVIDGGKILRYDRSPHPTEYEDKFYAIGSGRDFALAAMHCGKTAREAVEIACAFECSCGNGIDELEL